MLYEPKKPGEIIIIVQNFFCCDRSIITISHFYFGNSSLCHFLSLCLFLLCSSSLPLILYVSLQLPPPFTPVSFFLPLLMP